MSAGSAIAVIVPIVVIAFAIMALAVRSRRRWRVKQQLGPRSDRAVIDNQSQPKPEADLAGQERRVSSLDTHPLSPAARTEYTAQWSTIQERFADQPVSAVAQAQLLVTAVLDDRGYPTEGYEQMLADRSIPHASTLEHYREAHEISESARRSSASTESLREAMTHYRAMFDDLLG